MKYAIIALTRNACELALEIGYSLNADIYVKDSILTNKEAAKSKDGLICKYLFNGDMVLVHPFTTNFGKLVEKVFLLYDGLVFIMACGIVVRSIAPYLKCKTEDPAVVVVDEMGRFAISLLSGHIGGANMLAEKVSSITGGIPVITTATDINNVIAFDVFAKENGCVIENISDLKYISSELVNGGSTSLYTDCSLRGALPSNVVRYESGQACKLAVALSNRTDIQVNAEKVLILRPKNLILGIGCKKGKNRAEIEAAVRDFLQRNKRSILSVRRVASIDLKAHEAGIVSFCEDNRIEFATYPIERIKAIEGQFKSSQFVKKVTGVGNVCETSAVLAGEKARLICPKTVYGGITLALAEEERSYYI